MTADNAGAAERCPAILAGSSVRCERVYPHSDPHENVNVGATWRNDGEVPRPGQACGQGNADGTHCQLPTEHDGNHYDGIGYWAAGTRPLAPELGDVWRCHRHGSPSCAVCALAAVRAAHLASEPSSGAAGNTHPSQSSDAYGLPNDLRAAKEEISEWRSAIEALGVMGGPDALRRVAIEKSRHHDEHHEREARLLTLVQRAVTFVPFAQDTPHHFTEATIWLRDAAAALAADGSGKDGG